MEEIIQSIYILFNKPIEQQLSENNEIECLRDLLTIYHPIYIHNAVIDGVNSFLRSDFGGLISKKTYFLLKRAISDLEGVTEQLIEIWRGLDEYDENEIWTLTSEGMFSDETILGTTIGSLILPGLGTVIGAFLGGRAAGKRIQNKVREAIEYYAKGIQRYCELYEEYQKEIIFPVIIDDLIQLAERYENESNLDIYQQPKNETNSNLKKKKFIIQKEYKKNFIVHKEFKKKKFVIK